MLWPHLFVIARQLCYNGVDMGKAKQDRPNGVNALFAGDNIKRGKVYQEVRDYILGLEKMKDQLRDFHDELERKQISELGEYK